jgi:hypothetical protein
VFHPQICSLQTASPAATAPPRHSVRNRSVPPSGRRTMPCRLYKEMGVRSSSAARAYAVTPAPPADTACAKCHWTAVQTVAWRRLLDRRSAARPLAHARASTAGDGACAGPGRCPPFDSLHASNIAPSLHGCAVHNAVDSPETR